MSGQSAEDFPRNETSASRQLVAASDRPTLVGVSPLAPFAQSTARVRRSRWGFWCAAFAVLGLFAGLAYAFWERPFQVQINLALEKGMFANESELREFIDSALAPDTLSLVGAQVVPPVTANVLRKHCAIETADDTSTLVLVAEAESAVRAVVIVNAWAERVVDHAREWRKGKFAQLEQSIATAQTRLNELRLELRDASPDFLNGRATDVEANVTREATDLAVGIRSLRSQIRALEVEETNLLVTAVASDPSLKSLQDSLNLALARYTEEHPRVKELRAAIAALRNQQSAETGVVGSSPGALRLIEVRARKSALQEELSILEERQTAIAQAAQRLAERETEYTRAQTEYALLNSRRDTLLQSKLASADADVRIWRSAELADAHRRFEMAAAALPAMAGGAAGLLLGLIGLGMAGRRAGQIRDGHSLEAATCLPLLATLEDLETMSRSEREYWATAALAALERTAGSQRGANLICGVTSASSGEGRSTFIDLLADAGVRQGNRVLVVSHPDCKTREASKPAPSEDGASESMALALEETRAGTEQTHALVRYDFIGNAAQPALRQEWERALRQWGVQDNALILVELPPASTAEGLLLSTSVPNVVWLAGAGVASVGLTRKCIHNLKNTGCRLVGAALNASPRARWKFHANRILTVAAVASIAAVSNWLAPAQEAAPAPGAAVTNGLSAARTPILAPWQQRLTLGPGDVLDISLYGQPDSLRTGIIIAPDGRITYLQASEVMAAGLTVDELRASMEEALGKYHLAPRVVIVPTAYNSKKYFVLGNVQQRGPFTLERPTSVVEAVARAGGFVSTSQNRSTFNLADLSRAFLIRRQGDGTFARQSVDFESLFLRGDLRHNLLLAPDDYLYFPPVGLKEVYVLGEVPAPGTAPFTQDITVLGAISARGGFTEQAYRRRVLVVRGSLVHPETFVIDTASILRAATPDFRLQPRDIVYVSRKPWAKAEELLESAASDFLRAVVVTWTGDNIKPVLR